jgi:hypothetical protein
MKHRTADLSGPHLDAAVAMAEGLGAVSIKPMPFHVHEALRAVYVDDKGVEQLVPGYSTDWKYGGSIIERERIMLIAHKGGWSASVGEVGDYVDTRLPLDQRYSDWPGMSGPTPLIAICRAYVASRLGDEVELPE